MIDIVIALAILVTIVYVIWNLMHEPIEDDPDLYVPEIKIDPVPQVPEVVTKIKRDSRGRFVAK